MALTFGKHDVYHRRMSELIHPLKAYRERHGMTQFEAARHFGISRVMVNRIEVGKSKPSLKLCDEKFAPRSGGELTRYVLRPDIFERPAIAPTALAVVPTGT